MPLKRKKKSSKFCVKMENDILFFTELHRVPMDAFTGCNTNVYFYHYSREQFFLFKAEKLLKGPIGCPDFCLLSKCFAVGQIAELEEKQQHDILRQRCFSVLLC